MYLLFMLGTHCESMCASRIVDGYAQTALVALEDFAEGEEVTYDYRWQDYGVQPAACHCGSEDCSALIGLASRSS